MLRLLFVCVSIFLAMAGMIITKVQTTAKAVVCDSLTCSEDLQLHTHLSPGSWAEVATVSTANGFSTANLAAFVGLDIFSARCTTDGDTEIGFYQYSLCTLVVDFQLTEPWNVLLYFDPLVSPNGGVAVKDMGCGTVGGCDVVNANIFVLPPRDAVLPAGKYQASLHQISHGDGLFEVTPFITFTATPEPSNLVTSILTAVLGSILSFRRRKQIVNIGNMVKFRSIVTSLACITLSAMKTVRLPLIAILIAHSTYGALVTMYFDVTITERSFHVVGDLDWTKDADFIPFSGRAKASFDTSTFRLSDINQVITDIDYVSPVEDIMLFPNTFDPGVHFFGSPTFTTILLYAVAGPRGLFLSAGSPSGMAYSLPTNVKELISVLTAAKSAAWTYNEIGQAWGGENPINGVDQEQFLGEAVLVRFSVVPEPSTFLLLAFPALVVGGYVLRTTWSFDHLRNRFTGIFKSRAKVDLCESRSRY